MASTLWSRASPGATPAGATPSWPAATHSQHRPLSGKISPHRVTLANWAQGRVPPSAAASRRTLPRQEPEMHGQRSLGADQDTLANWTKYDAPSPGAWPTRAPRTRARRQTRRKSRLGYHGRRARRWRSRHGAARRSACPTSRRPWRLPTGSTVRWRCSPAPRNGIASGRCSQPRASAA